MIAIWGSMDILSLLVGFVVGGFTGAAGTFYGNMYTDQRREREKKRIESNDWENLKIKFPLIVKEMCEDVNNPDFSEVRTFFVKDSGTLICKAEPSFDYYTDVHSDIKAALSYMEDLGYIKEITPKDCLKYRFHEHFYALLKNNY